MEFFTKFKELLDKLESDFDGEWSSNSSLNNFFFEYERHVQVEYLLSCKNTKKHQYQEPSMSMTRMAN